ncbi:MAG: adenylate/guanylate cyclase domain-containing protein [Gemmataceae bacterium]
MLLSLFPRLTHQSRLVVMLLLVSVLSVFVVGGVSYTSSVKALKDRTFNRLDALRRARTASIQDSIKRIQNQVITFSEDESVVQATLAFRQAFNQLDGRKLEDKQLASLRSYYKTKFLPELAKNVSGEPTLDTYFPTRPATRYLQYHYIVSNPNEFGDRENLQQSADGSDYSAVHQKYHPFFHRISDRFNYIGVMLIAPDTGDVLYTSDKNVDLGTNILNGPYAGSNLARLVQTLGKSSDRNEFKMVDFEPYKPARARPAAFVASPVFAGPQCVGLLVMQFPIDGMNRTITGNGSWKRDSLGETGEIYLVGEDNLLRTASRFQITDPERYYKMLRQNGYSAAQVERIKWFGTSILQQSVRSPAAERALLGEEGTAVVRDYRGVECLTSYGPLEIAGLHWGIVAKMDLTEAYAPAYELGHKLLVVLAAVVLIVSLLAVVLASYHVRPVARLIEGVRAVSAGRTDVTVELETHDELRELADAFNTMTRTLQSKTELLDQKTRENVQLLLNVMPASAAVRLREGQQQITDSFADVTVLYVQLEGLEEVGDRLPGEQVVNILNELVVAFDEQAERFGVEKVRTAGASYLAACGLSVPRLDHANRGVEFALELLRVVRRFNHERSTSLSLQIGVSAGPVVGGVIGRSKFVYELWGATVDRARELAADGPADTVRLTDAVQERLRDLYEFDRMPEVRVGGKPLEVWSVKVAA